MVLALNTGFLVYFLRTNVKFLECTFLEHLLLHFTYYILVWLSLMFAFSWHLLVTLSCWAMLSGPSQCHLCQVEGVYYSPLLGINSGCVKPTFDGCKATELSGIRCKIVICLNLYGKEKTISGLCKIDLVFLYWFVYDFDSSIMLFLWQAIYFWKLSFYWTCFWLLIY